MFNLFLDDERFPFIDPKDRDRMKSSAYHYTKYEPFRTENWVIVRNFYQFISEIKKNGVPTKVSFDHDLGKKEDGYDCAKWLCNYCQDNNIKFPEYFVHSMNSVGAENITSYIENYKKYVEDV
jgi:hypothetical protein